MKEHVSDVDSNRKRLVIVLGMHRSGTSAITRALKVLGVELGNRLMPANEHENAAGYWEDLDLYQLNVDMLEALGRDWDHVAPLAADFAAQLREGFHLRAVDLVRQKLTTCDVFGFKDPRVALLLPFWKDVFRDCGADVSYVLTTRNPVSVIKSLERRNEFDPHKGAILWLMHTVAMLEGIAGERSCVLIDYDVLMESPEAELTRVSAALGLPVNAAELEVYRTQFLDRQLRHTTYGTEDVRVSEVTAPAVYGLYLAVLKVATGKLTPYAPSLKSVARKARQTLAGWEYPLRLIDTLYLYKHNARRELAECNAREQELKSRLAAAEATVNIFRDTRDQMISTSRAEGEARELQLKMAHRELEMQREQVGALTRDLGTRDQMISSFRAEGEARELQLKVAHRDLEMRREQVGALTRDLGTRDQRISVLVAEVQALRSMIADKEARQIAEANALRRDIAEKESELGAAHRELASRRAEVESLMNVADGQEQKAAVLRLDLDSALQTIATLEQKASEQADVIRAAQVSREILSNELSEGRSLAALLNADCASLRQSVAERDQEIAALRGRVAENDVRSENLRGIVGVLHRKIWQPKEFSSPKWSPPEPNEAPPPLSWLLNRDGSAFVGEAYRVLLRREPDVAGLQYYNERLRAGTPKLQILQELSSSPEGRSVDCQVPGLGVAIGLHRLTKLPVFGRVIASALNLDSTSPLHTQVRSLQQQLVESSHLFDLHMDHIREDVQLLWETTSAWATQPQVAAASSLP
jgi:hypothetical protein